MYHDEAFFYAGLMFINELSTRYYNGTVSVKKSPPSQTTASHSPFSTTHHPPTNALPDPAIERTNRRCASKTPFLSHRLSHPRTRLESEWERFFPSAWRRKCLAHTPTSGSTTGRPSHAPVYFRNRRLIAERDDSPAICHRCDREFFGALSFRVRLRSRRPGCEAQRRENSEENGSVRESSRKEFVFLLVLGAITFREKIVCGGKVGWGGSVLLELRKREMIGHETKNWINNVGASNKARALGFIEKNGLYWKHVLQLKYSYVA